jgi:HEAT repeat protein
VSTLGSITDVQVVESLLSALQDADGRVRARATAYALGHSGDPRALQPLLAALQDSGMGGYGRAIVAGALGRIGDTRAVEPLRATLQDGDQLVAAGARWALHHLQGVG